ncbi:MAG TPA: GLPGLI family protein [Flavobacterium lutivivi]|nr:GLPGLI family protein [Flavobacterium lutivivi]
MKLYCSLIIFLINLTAFGQIKSGTVEYSLAFANDDQLDNGQLSNYMKDAKKNAHLLSFILDFENDEMIFYKKEILSSDGNGDVVFAEAFSGVQGKYYRTKNATTLFSELDDAHIGHYIIEKENNINWTLVNETKQIDQYLCLKATTFIIVKNSAGEFKREIIAWYCPSIPTPFGPKGYGDLPGLILELQERNVIFGAKKIILNQTSSPIVKPDIKKAISEAEYNKMLEKIAPQD